MVTVYVPAAAVALAVKVSRLAPVVGLVPNTAVTPLGKPDAASVTLPVNPPESITVMVSVPLLPSAIDSADAERESVKFGGPVTVRLIVVDAVSVPEIPVMVTVDVPGVAVALAVSVSRLVPVVGLVPNAAVTPLGKPDATKLTLPVNPPASVTVMVSVPLLPWAIDRVGADAESVKPGLVTVRAMVVDAVSVPEVPVIVTADDPAVAVLLAVSVSRLVPVVGLVANAAVTPVGRPEAVRVTLPVNPPTSVTAIVSVPLLP
jgi:hypothetical protein